MIKIVSGGQTGVDRAALAFALERQIPSGGWCPRGRKAEDGPIPALFVLHETPSSSYSQRTEWNVRDSDATLILTRGPLKGGTALTVTLATRHGKPFQVVFLTDPWDIPTLQAWLVEKEVTVLNVAGPRESEHPGIFESAKRFLHELFP